MRTALSAATVFVIGSTLILGRAGSPDPQLRTVADLTGAHVRYRAFIGHMDEDAFSKLAMQVLARPEVTLGAVAVYASTEDYAISAPRNQSECSYEGWRAVVDRSNARCPDIKEAIKIGSAIVLRRADGRCALRTKLLTRGEDPLTMAVAGHKVEVLSVRFSRPMGRRNADRISADLFLRTHGPVSTELASAVLKRIREVTSAAYLGVQLRSDVWFITSCGFPSVYAFEDRGSPPTQDRYAATKQVSCFVSGSWTVRCFEGAAAP